MANYEDNAYNWLKRKGLAAKYEFAGIYCIKVDNEIVYIGKSGNMLRRIAQHYAGIQMGTEKKIPHHGGGTTQRTQHRL